MSNPYAAAEAFATDFRQMEYALKRSKFVRKGKKIAEADWDHFATSLGPAFFDDVVSRRIAETLISSPPRQLLADLTWSPETTSPLANSNELIIHGVCRVRNSYIHGEKFIGGPEKQWRRDIKLILEAHAVLTRAMEFVSTAI